MTLSERIASAATAVGGALTTDGHNKEQRYDYISADKILTVAGRALTAAGVVVVPSITETDITVGQTASGKARYDARVTFSMTLTDGESSFSFPWVGAGTDYGVPDKAIYKAITSGHKYFLSKLLMIGVGNEDGEHDSPEDAPGTYVQRARFADTKPQPETVVTGNGNGHKSARPKPATNSAWPIELDEIQQGALEAVTGIMHDPNIELSRPVVKLIEHVTAAHKGSRNPMTEKQYGFLVGLLNKQFGEGSHPWLLAAMTGQICDSENRPGFDVKELIDWLKSDDETDAKRVEIMGQLAAVVMQYHIDFALEMAEEMEA